MPTTPQFFDPGEEYWPLKLHVGCGGVYLRGYVNLDIQGTLVADIPQEGQPIGRDVRDYYAPGGDWSSLPTPAGNIVDRLASFAALPAEVKGADKILAVQCLEHLTRERAIETLAHWRQWLRPGGVVIVTVPDVEETLAWSIHEPARHTFGSRHIYGSHKDPYNVHLSAWTPALLADAMFGAGFTTQLIANPHCYPAVCARGMNNA